MKNRHLFFIAALTAFIFLSRRGVAQEKDSTKLVMANSAIIHSTVLGEDRKIDVYTPDLARYEQFKGQAMPVLYLLDGDALTSLVAAELSYLSSNYLILPPMIIVGIHNYDYNRMRDLTPSQPINGFDGNMDPKSFGGGEKFIRFIKTELMPFINSHYKTEPFSILAGHSMSALLSFHCLVNYPTLFNAYIAISPSLWWDSSLALKQAANKLAPGMQNRFLFFSDASEGGTFHSAVLSLDSMLQQKKLSGLDYKYVYYPEESHGSEPVKAIADALKFIYPQWYPQPGDSTAVQVATSFRKLSARYGYSIQPPEWFVAKRGTRILGNGRVSDAIDFFELNIINYPGSYTAWEMLGSACEKKGDQPKALACYQKAAALDPTNKEIIEKIQRLQHR
jgi:predicted alpha/beta superfamily hydrolase